MIENETLQDRIRYTIHQFKANGKTMMLSKGEVRHSFFANGRAGKGSMQGVVFYRLMSMIGIFATLVFAGYFLVISPGENELCFDRALILALCLGTHLYSYKRNLVRKRLYRAMNVIFYGFTAQTIVAAGLHGFAFEYLAVVLLTLQAISISFKDLRQTISYLLFVNLLTTSLVIWFKVDGYSPYFVSGSLLISTVLLFLVVRIKDTFQRHLSLQNELMQTIVTKSQEAKLITDFEGIIYEASDQVERILGYTPEEIKGVDFTKIRHTPLSEEEDRDGVHKLLTNRFWNNEVVLKRKDGTTFMAFVSIGYFRKFDVEYLLYRVRDISEEYNARQEILKAKEEAEKALRAKSDFLAMMSHEIRTPMNGIIGMTELLRGTTLNTAQQRFIDTISNCGRDLLVIINDILDFAKIESGKLDFEESVFEPHAMVNDLILLLGNQASEKGISLTAKLGHSVPRYLLGDALRIRQVLINLLGNALKFTMQGSVHIEVQCIAVNRFRFSVVDTGIGIREDDLPRLFESFVQVDSGASRRFGGTGLGLAITKRIVEAMGGQVSVQSEFQKGSRFDVELPLTVVDETEIKVTEAKAASNTASGTPEHEGNSRFASLKVLVAEDNAINRQVIGHLLQRLDVEPIMALNGKEAVDLSNSYSVDLILMDLQMPEMDGIEATRHILIRDQGNAPQIVAMTANVLPEDRRRCTEAGMVGFLPKPMLLEDLKLVLEEALQRQL